MEDTFTSYFDQESIEGGFCFNYNNCVFQLHPCLLNETHPQIRYNDASAVWVLICAIIVFFMKSGFLLIELSFAQNVREKRHVVVVKHLDAFASAFGFFLIGYDFISQYSSHQNTLDKFFEITDPVLWFFKFTFASNAATILGGCLVTNKYKLRLPAAFISAFIISGIIHPIIARLIWSDKHTSFSPYRFCNQSIFNCQEDISFKNKLYILDFAGGGAVHLLGGVAGLVLCLFAKLQNYITDRRQQRHVVEQINEQPNQHPVVRERQELVMKRDFWEWMYPVDGGGETTSEAALGVLILWFCWFAFNCGSTESIESSQSTPVRFHAIPSFIAVNMILAAASGGVLSVLIASWAQIRSQSESVNANEIANGVLSALVAITAGCPFVDFSAACIIGAIAVVVYHVGCWLEYKFNIEDTARVVPVHGLCGLWSLLAVGIFLFGEQAKCSLHSTFEGLCYCSFRLPPLSYGERIAAQLIGAIIMIGITGVISFIMYGVLFIIPIKTYFTSDNKCANGCNKFLSLIFRIIFNRETLNFEGNLLFTGPGEIPHPDDRLMREIARVNDDDDEYRSSLSEAFSHHNNYGAVNRNLPRETHSNVSTVSVETPLSAISGDSWLYSRFKSGGQRNGNSTKYDEEQ